MLWVVTKVALYGLAYLLLTHALYRILSRFEPVRKVVISYHVLMVLLAVLIFHAFAQKLGVTEEDLMQLDRTYMKVLLGVIAFFAVLVVLRLVDSVFVGYFLGQRLGIRISVIARHLAVVIILAATVILALAVCGVKVGPLLATSAVGTAIIGLALQDVLGNVIAGVALQAERPFKVGDWVHIGDIMGRVVEMNWRATKLATLDYDHVILPNSTVSRERIRNYCAPGPVEARHLHVGVEYGAPPGRVKSVLMEATLGAEGVLHDPAPKIRLIDYGDFAITYDIKFWLDRFADHDDIQDAVMTRVWYLLRRNDITIPFPIRNVFHHRGAQTFAEPILQPGSPEVTEILHGVELVRSLNEEEIGRLSNRLTVALFDTGEVLVRQDEPGDSFLIIASGKVSVRVNDSEVATLSDRQHFGEMSLLTGEPRSATVVALTDTRVLIIDRECFESILKANPAVAERLSQVLERINAQNLARMQAQGVADPQAKPTPARSLLKLVRGFFGLH